MTARVIHFIVQPLKVSDPPPKNEYETMPRYEEMDPCLHILSSYIPYGKG